MAKSGVNIYSFNQIAQNGNILFLLKVLAFSKFIAQSPWHPDIPCSQATEPFTLTSNDALARSSAG